MNKRMREIQTLIDQKTAEAKGYTEGENKDMTKAAAIMDEVDKLDAEFKTLERIEKANKAAVPADPTPAEPKKVDGVKALADAARSGFKVKDFNETNMEDGGYTVPEDIQTKVNEYKQERFSLRTLIDYEKVDTNKGRRTYKKRSQHTGFTKVGEGGKIGKIAAPQFEIMEYEISKFAGFMPSTNELLADSDAAIANTIVEWLGEEGIATENVQTLALFNQKEATAMTGLDDIKKAVNVTLAAFAGSVRIVTNSDGLQYLDTLVDGNGRYLLSPDPVKPMEMYLSVGVRRIPVVVVPNEVMPSTEGGAIPFIIGDTYAYAKEFDRQTLTIKTSDVAVIGDFNAYEEDLTLWRGIMRADWRVKDDLAIVRGELTPAED